MLKLRLRLESLEDRTVPTANPVDSLTDPLLAPPADPTTPDTATATTDTQPATDGTLIPLAPQPPVETDDPATPTDPTATTVPPTDPADPAAPIVVSDEPPATSPDELPADPNVIAISGTATGPDDAPVFSQDPPTGADVSTDDPNDVLGTGAGIIGQSVTDLVDGTSETPIALAQKDRPLGLQLIDYGPLIATNPIDDVPGARETSVTKLKGTLSDGKFGYSFTFDFVVGKEYSADRRYLLQALKSNLVLVAPDGSVSRPTGATKENGYSTFKVDQKDLTGLNPKPGAASTAQDIRLAGPLGADGGEVIGPDKDKLTPAVFGIQVVDSVAGLSGLNYQPIKGDGGKLSNLSVTEANYKQVRDAIVLQKTETRTVYIFYNPGAYKGEGDASKIVLEALEKSDPATRKMVEDALKKMKLTLGNKGFESYSFSNFTDLNPALTVPIK